MKRFLIKTTLFLAIGAIWMAANYSWNVAQAESVNPVEGRDQARIIVAGDSQMLRAFNPSLQPSSISICQTAEPYFATYWKVKKLLPHFKKAETLILSFGPHCFSSYHLDKAFGPSRSQRLFERIYSIEEFDQMEGVEINWRGLYGMKVKKMCLFPSSEHAPFISHYENTNASNLGNPRKSAKRHYRRNGKNAGEWKPMMGYLEKIADLCEAQGVRLVLVGVPVHPSYVELVPKNFREIYARHKATMIERGIKVLDLRQTRFPDEEYRDNNHLNNLGAERFTKMLAAELGL